MRMIALPITLAALLAAGAAFAQGTGTTPQSGVQAQPQKATPEQRFQEMDANKDGKVTRQEFMTSAELHWTRMLERMDDSKDGAVSKEEFLTPKAPRTGGQQPQR